MPSTSTSRARARTPDAHRGATTITRSLPDRDCIRLSAGDASLVVSAADGGRIASLTIGGHEVIATVDEGPIWWGSFPMAPFAGRVRDGQFSFRGKSWQLPLDLPPHAIHGTVYRQPWTIVDEATIAIRLGDPWPFPGSVVQRFSLEPSSMRVTMALRAEQPMPASIGWHPWFRRRLTESGADVDLRFEPELMFEQDATGIPTGRLVEPTERPWDDCFTGVRADPVLRWGDVLELTIGSSCDCWVVFDQRPDGICVEPQTAPPDALNAAPAIVEPGVPLLATMEWRWQVG